MAKHRPRRSKSAKSDELTPQQLKNLEKKLRELGKTRYDLDDETAREWARRLAVA